VPDFSVDPADLDGALTLAVGWRRGQHVEGGRVDLTGDIADVLRQVCVDAAEQLGELEAKPYTADTYLEDEEYLTVGSAHLDGAGEVLEIVRGAAELDRLRAQDIPSRPLLFYAMVIGDDPDERVGFIRNANPMMAAKQGRVLTTLRNALTLLQRPVFSFDDRVDVIVLPDGLVVTNQPAFERLFRGLPALVEKVPEWLAEIAQHLPIDADAMVELDERSRSDSRLRRRLLAIHERAHLATVSAADIRAEAKRQGIDPKSVLRNGQLVLDGVDAGTLLRLLNEDLMTGGLSGTRFSVERKAPR
jgi:hypothetical protein